MPVVICPSCKQMFGYLEERRGADVDCVCGHTFSPVICLGTDAPANAPIIGRPVPPPRKPIINVDFDPPRSNLNLTLTLLVVLSVFVCGLFLVVVTRPRTQPQELVTNRPTQPAHVDPPVAPKPAAKPVPIFEVVDADSMPNPLVIPDAIVEADPYDDLESRLTQKLPGLVFSHRATSAPGRSIRDAQLRVVIVVASNDPAKTEAMFKKEAKKVSTTHRWQSFVFIGDKALMDSIKVALSSEQ